jgi:hypothetical protein
MAIGRPHSSLVAALVTGAALVLLAPAPAAARPAPPAPDHPAFAPPPAWLETARAERWLAYSSYCWTTPTRGLCADYANPRSRTDLPRFAVSRGEIVRIHLGFVPTEAYVEVGRRSPRVEAGRILEVRIRESGVLIVHVYSRQGDASYVARLLVR